MNKRGRPKIFTDQRRITVLVSAEDHNRMRAAVQKRQRADQPAFTMADLLRIYIRRGLTDHREPR